MKRMLPPILVLAALLAFSLWNIRHMEGETDRWQEQLHAADRLALSGALIAAFLNIRLRHALPAITLGLLIAGSLVTLMTLGLIHLL